MVSGQRGCQVLNFSCEKLQTKQDRHEGTLPEPTNGGNVLRRTSNLVIDLPGCASLRSVPTGHNAELFASRDGNTQVELMNIVRKHDIGQT